MLLSVPSVQTGVGTIYNKSIWHGVTRMTKGSRYTLSFFYDEPPSIREGSSTISITFINQRKASRAEKVVIYWVNNLAAVTNVSLMGQVVLSKCARLRILRASFCRLKVPPLMPQM